MPLPPPVFQMPPRQEYLPQPGNNFIVDVVNESPMRHLAMQSVAAERDALYRQRLQAAGPPTPNSPVSPNAGGLPPAPAPATTPAVDAGPRLLSPPEWAAKFMPNLANQPYVSARQQRLLDSGYQAYVQEVQNEQGRARFITNEQAQESRFSRGLNQRQQEMGVDQDRVNAMGQASAARESGLERRHQENIASREKIAAMRPGSQPDPQKEAFKLAFEQAYAQNKDPLKALAAASLALKGGPTAGTSNPMHGLESEVIEQLRGQGKDPMSILSEITAGKRAPGKETSFLDKGALNDDLFGWSAIPGEKPVGGKMVGDQWDEDPMNAFKELQQLVRTKMVVANDEEKTKLREILRSRAPYGTIEEAAAAYYNGEFDPPESSGVWNAINPFRYAGGESQEEKAQRMEAARQEFDQYLLTVFSPEEIDAYRTAKQGG